MKAVIGYQLRRARDSWWGHDLAVLRRLKRQGRIVYGPGSYGNPVVHTFDHDPARLIVANYSSIGGTYMLGGQHPAANVTTYPFRINYRLPGAGSDGYPTPRGDTHVGSDVWTGYGSWIMGGVTIGDGAVVGTGSVVTKDVPPYAIVGGAPARVIRFRHSEEQREALLDIRWWDWPESDILAAVDLIASDNVDGFIAYARRQNG